MDPECARMQIDGVKDIGDGKDAIVFQDLEDAEREGRAIEVVVFVVDPTRLSALMQLASYSKRTKGPASIAPFGTPASRYTPYPKRKGSRTIPAG